MLVCDAAAALPAAACMPVLSQLTALVVPPPPPPCHAVLHTFTASAAGGARMQADLRSRGLLVAWVALCCVHAAAARRHPLLLEYGVGVDWHDLRHLALSDRPAVDAALATAAYLRAHTRSRAVFTLADGGRATFDLARRFALQDPALLRLQREEQAAAEQRKAAHWAAVSAKKAEVAQLRRRLEGEEAAEASAKQQYTNAYNEWNCLRIYSEGRAAAERRKDAAAKSYTDAQSSCARTNTAIESALVPPEPVLQPLPAAADASGTWLFFLHMPPLLRRGTGGGPVVCLRLMRLMRLSPTGAAPLPRPPPSRRLQAAGTHHLPGTAAAAAARR